MRRATIAIVVLLLVAGGATSLLGLGDTADPGRPDVVVLSINSLRADHLSCYGYERNTTPNICAIAEDGYRYSEAYSQYRWTTPSETSIHTGLYPAVHGITLGPDGSVGQLASDITTLAERLRSAGYSTRLLIPRQGDQNYTYPRGSNITQGVDAIRPAGLMGSVVGRVSEQLREPTPQYIHALPMDLHRPYPVRPSMKPRYMREYNGSLRRVLGEGRSSPALLADLTYAPEEGYRLRVNDTMVSLDARDLRFLRDSYDSVLWNVDQRIGTVMDRLRLQDDYSDSLIIVTAPHGERLGEPYPEPGRRVFGHPFPQPATLHVPLIIKPPGDTDPRTIEQPVELIDIYPTVMDVLGIAGPDMLQGDSLMPPYQGSEYVFSGEGVARNASWVLYGTGAPGYEEVVLHDRSVRPSERDDVGEEYPGIRADLLDRLRSWEDGNAVLRSRILGW